MGVGDPVTFVAKRLRFLFELLAGVDEHDAATMAGRLLVS